MRDDQHRRIQWGACSRVLMLGRNCTTGMSSISARFLLVLCFAMLSACSRDVRDRSPHGIQKQATGTSASKDIAAPVALNSYPYGLALGNSFYKVDQEPGRERLIVELVKWSDNPEGGKEAVFRVTNRGERAVLVWNVRQQVCVPSSEEVARVWETRRSDYPGRGWQRSMIPAEESEVFPMRGETDGDWRVCLLYSREIHPSEVPNRQFDGTFESIGPSVRDAD